MGNTRAGRPISDLTRDHPHLRGEYLSSTEWAECRLGSPPLAWGILTATTEGVVKSGITPTCVGNTPRLFLRYASTADHPHLRGEYLVHSIKGMTRPGSPPLAWGIQFNSRGITAEARITPTCVGNTSPRWPGKLCTRDHPHLRGEYERVGLCTLCILGSPPLAWGIRIGRKATFSALGITPTCVGNT